MQNNGRATSIEGSGAGETGTAQAVHGLWVGERLVPCELAKRRRAREGNRGVVLAPAFTCAHTAGCSNREFAVGCWIARSLDAHERVASQLVLAKRVCKTHSACHVSRGREPWLPGRVTRPGAWCRTQPPRALVAWQGHAAWSLVPHTAATSTAA